MVERYEQVRVEQRDRVLLLTLDRAEKLNAWTWQMMAELVDAVGAANDDPSVGAIVVTGAGRGFCAGADIEAVFAAGDHEQGEGAADWVALCRSSKPMLAAINGAAIGVGLTMVLPFDQLLAAQGAKLSMRFVKMGVVPELASTRFLVARCGWGAASWLALSGDTVTAEDALALGLVDRVVPQGRLLEDAVGAAAALASNPPSAMRAIKDLLTRNAVDADLAAVQHREGVALAEAYRSAEHREAVRAFMEKRPPRFT